jgi:hypothetical protein
LGARWRNQFEEVRGLRGYILNRIAALNSGQPLAQERRMFPEAERVAILQYVQERRAKTMHDTLCIR